MKIIALQEIHAGMRPEDSDAAPKAALLLWDVGFSSCWYVGLRFKFRFEGGVLYHLAADNTDLDPVVSARKLLSVLKSISSKTPSPIILFSWETPIPYTLPTPQAVHVRTPPMPMLDTPRLLMQVGNEWH